MGVPLFAFDFRSVDPIDALGSLPFANFVRRLLRCHPGSPLDRQTPKVGMILQGKCFLLRRLQTDLQMVHSVDRVGWLSPLFFPCTYCNYAWLRVEGETDWEEFVASYRRR